MKAIVYKTYGPAEVLQLEERPTPQVGAHEVLIQVRAVEATKSDCEMRSLQFAVNWFVWPLRLFLGLRAPRRPVLGNYFSGVVAEVGPRVTRFSKGDAIFGGSQFRFGGYAEYVSVPETYSLSLLPTHTSFEEAAVLLLGGYNAMHFMHLANIRPGERVLVVGAGGSIGAFAVQIARAMGAEVTAVDAPHKEAGIRGFGASQFIDYTRQNFWETDARYDVVFSLVARMEYRHALAVLNPGGRYLMGNPKLSDMLRAVWTNGFSDKHASFAFAPERQEDLERIKSWVEQGRIKAPLDRVYPFEQAAAAHQRVELEERVGCVVLSPVARG